MLRITNLKLPLSYDDALLRRKAAECLHIRAAEIASVTLVRRAVDARRNVHFTVSADVILKDE